MKKILIIISFCMLVLSSCTKSYEVHYDFGFDREELRFAAKDTASYFLVYGEGNWTLRMSEEVAWVSIDKFEGNGTTQVNVRVHQNEGVARDVKVIATFEDNREKELIISQQTSSSSNKAYSLSVSTLNLLKLQRDFTISATAKFIEESLLELKYWVKYESEDGQNWIENLKLNYTDATFSVTENTTSSDRVAHIYWTFPVAHWETQDTLSVKIVQSSQAPALELEDNYSLDSEGRDSLKIAAKTNWDESVYNFDISSFKLSDGVTGKYSKSGKYLALIAPANTSREVRNFNLEWSIKENENVIAKYDVGLTQNFYVEPKNLTPNGEWANCYILNDQDEELYSIDVKMISGAKPADDIVSAEVLWETSLGLITKCNYDANKNQLIIGKAKNAKGNAVVKLMTSDGTIRWSYHFWMTNAGTTLPEVTIGGYTFLDRNIGALTNQAPVSDESDAAGMHYQWGRKDPFPSAKNLASNNAVRMSVYPDAAVTMKAAQDGVTLADATANPGTYYWGSGASGNENWCSEIDENYWNTETKTNYDPCPYGYVVPNKEQLSKVIAAVKVTKNKGFDFTCDDSSTNFWAAGGWYRRTHNNDYQLANATKLYYWTTTSDVYNTNYRGSYSMQEGKSLTISARRWGANIRCVKETKTE